MNKRDASLILSELADQCAKLRGQPGRLSYDQSIKNRVRDLIASGADVTEVSKALGVSYNSICAWSKLPPDSSNLRWMTVTDAPQATAEVPAFLQFRAKDFELTIFTKGSSIP